MRPGILLGTLGLGTLATLVLVLFSPKERVTSNGEPAAAVPAEHSQEWHPESLSARDDASALTQLPGTGDSRTHSARTAEDDQAAAEHRATSVAARISELSDLSRKPDTASLQTLLSELSNPDQEIREAALDIISQSGNRAAIPGLIQAAEHTQDAAERKAILDAIEFLKLPTLTEVLRQAEQGSGNRTGAEATPSAPPTTRDAASK